MIVVDVETSSLDPERGSIVGIGAVDFNEPTRQFYAECRIWPGAHVDPESLAINGFTHEQITDPARPTADEAMGRFAVWAAGARGRTLAGHNASFDQAFLQASFRRAKLAWPFGFRIIDMPSVCWAHMIRTGRDIPIQGGLVNLRARLVYAYVGLPEEPRPHHGLTGAKMEAEALCRLVRGSVLLEEFAAHPLPQHLTQSTLL